MRNAIEGEAVARPKAPLRSGWTTGTCATAAAAAAHQALLTDAFPHAVTVTLPRGGTVTLPVHRCGLAADEAFASVIKDAGDDPDVTHGAEIIATVRRNEAGTGVVFRGGEGIGTVTMPGLPLAVGEPAINPGPRAMIIAALTRIAEMEGGSADVTVTIAIPGGEALAAKTLNGRLGIRGGLSVLGTTGIVQPYSCAAWIHSIHRGIDVARAAGLRHLAAATGSVSETALRRLYHLPEQALIDMGDFAGGTLKYLRTHPVARLTVAGGIGKLAKLAQGQLYLHSSRSRVDLGDLVTTLAALGAGPDIVAHAGAAETAAQVVKAAGPYAGELATRIAERARQVALQQLNTSTAVEVVIVDRAGEIIGRAG